jgi:hypothetical protein
MEGKFPDIQQFYKNDAFLHLRAGLSCENGIDIFLKDNVLVPLGGRQSVAKTVLYVILSY